MVIKYFDNPELAYTTRKRYRTFNFVPFYQEEQRSVLLGDGASTQVKTSKNNICNYVMIDNTRWYVTSYVYINGGQVKLNLQRDVIGEFGLNDCYGKIERGYTDSVLRNRKELSLNQILKERKPLKPISNVYGNFSVDNHENEIWGILYIVKPADGSTNLTINIPGFEPIVTDYDFIQNNSSIDTTGLSDCYISFRVKFTNSSIDSYGHYPVYEVTIKYTYSNISQQFNSFNANNVSVRNLGGPTTIQATHDILLTASLSGLTDTELMNCAKQVGVLVGEAVFNNQNSYNGYTLPEVPNNLQPFVKDYNGITIKKDNQYYTYTTTKSSYNKYGTTTTDKLKFYNNYIVPYINNKQVTIGSKKPTITINSYVSSFDTLKLKSTLIIERITYTYRVLTPEEAGQFTLDVSKQLVDEPFLVLVFPLYNVKISGDSNYDIDKEKAFTIFNTIIEGLSGQNGQLVDAQIYPYCPILTSVASEYKGFPFFSINSSCYEHNCEIQLLPKSDVKKEYIEREYSLISPEQSSKFSFNFYDYVTEIEDVDGVNYAKLRIIVKTALKPYAIISSAVIQPNQNSLIGITYESDLRGAQPSSNGFECSLSSNAFETYKRQNSNYQQIFNLDKEELQKQHSVELVNDITSTVINTASATAMGAMAGASMADAGFWGDISGSRAVGAAVGGSVAGATVGGAMIAQTVVNNDLRKYEESLQQQRFDLNIGTIKNLPNSVNRISSFNEIILKNFWYNIEIYECSEYEKIVVDNFIERYGYGIGVFDYVVNYYKDGWFLRSTLISSSYAVNLHQIAEKELMGGIYYYEQS